MNEEQLARVYAQREERARRRLQKQREAMTRVARGLAGGDAVEEALTAMLRLPAARVDVAADLVAHHEHVRRIGERLREVARLKARAQENLDALTQDVKALGARWQKAQLRTLKAYELLHARNLERQICGQSDEEEQMLESWSGGQRAVLETATVHALGSTP